MGEKHGMAIEVSDQDAIDALNSGAPLIVDPVQFLYGVADSLAVEREIQRHVWDLIETVLDEWRQMKPITRQCTRLTAALEALEVATEKAHSGELFEQFAKSDDDGLNEPD